MDSTDAMIRILNDIPMSPQLLMHIKNTLLLRKGMQGMTEIGELTARAIIGGDQESLAVSSAMEELMFMGFLGPRKPSGMHEVANRSLLLRRK